MKAGDKRRIAKRMPSSHGIDDWRAAPPRKAWGRPRLAFFRLNRTDLPAFIRRHFDDHVDCLRCFFDVFVIEENCSYDEVCSRLEVDISLFESGVYVRANRRIADTHRHPEIPKAGLINADAYCVTRSVFFSDMDEWGVENFFTISMSLPSRLPHLHGRLFVWPNFADTRRFRTYPGGKRTPILFAGSMASNYPWRNRVGHLLRGRFASDSLPHGGWFDANRAKDVLSGEPYAQALSSSLIVPTCGTIAHELVRKHLEVPACGALLLAERTAAVEAAGFVDMETCVFADETDVVEKVDFLLSHRGEIERISMAGQRLVHARHDMSHRNQVFQWFDLARQLGPGKMISQPDPFGDMVIRTNENSPTPARASAVSRDRALLDRADRDAAVGEVESARAGYHAVLNYHFEAEAAIGLARTYLRCGNAALARKWSWDCIVRCIRLGAAEPDPVEWSVYILALLCAGKIQKANTAARCYSRLTHVELARVRHLIWLLTAAPPPGVAQRSRVSIHPDRMLTWAGWGEDVTGMLRACGQVELADRVEALIRDPEPVQPLSPARATAGTRRIGRAPLSLKYYRHYYRMRSHLARLYNKGVSTRMNPFPEVLAGRALKTIMLIGVPSDCEAGAMARAACRRSPEPCTLVTIGDLPEQHISPARAIGRGSNAFGDGAPLQFALPDRCGIVIGQAAAGLVSIEMCLQARLVFLANVDELELPALAQKLDAGASWKRVSLPTSAEDLKLIAWEPVTGMAKRARPAAEKVNAIPKGDRLADKPLCNPLDVAPALTGRG